MGVMEQLINGLGEKPSTVIQRGWGLRHRDLRKVLDARDADSLSSIDVSQSHDEVWPLLSHHRFNPGSLFGLGESGQVEQKALTLLLAYDGLVASDPIHDIEEAARGGHLEQALADLQRVVAQVAEVEPLIDAGLIRFVSTRPSFASTSRKAVLDALGLSDMVVFANFEQAFDDVIRYRSWAEDDYANQLGDLFEALNLERPKVKSAEETRRANAALASAVIYVSWQLAVCSENSGSDLTLTNSLEHRILNEVIRRSVPGFDPSYLQQTRGETRHVEKLLAGDIPNLDTKYLTSADALALRKDGVFESFRFKLKKAMDNLPSDNSDPMASGVAYATFRESMQEAARELRESGKKSTLGNLMKPTSTEVGLGITYSWLFSGDHGPTTTMLAEPLTKISMTVWSWLQGRRGLNGHQVAMRYFASMGSKPRRDSAG